MKYLIFTVGCVLETFVINFVGKKIEKLQKKSETVMAIRHKVVFTFFTFSVVKGPPYFLAVSEFIHKTF